MNMAYNLPELKVFQTNEKYDNIEYEFQKSITLNNNLKVVIEDVYKLALLNMGKAALSNFHLRYIEMFDMLVNNSKGDKELYDLSVSLSSSINSYFFNLNSNLSISDKNDLIKLKNILELSLILMDGVIEDNDISLAYESFFQIKRRIKKGEFYKKSFTYEKYSGDIKITISDVILNDSDSSQSPINVKLKNSEEYQ